MYIVLVNKGGYVRMNELHSDTEYVQDSVLTMNSLILYTSAMQLSYFYLWPFYALSRISLY